MAIPSSGLAFGRFLAPHLGHLHFLQRAAAQVENLTILVCSSPEDPVPGHLRYACLKELLPACKVLHLSGKHWPDLPGDLLRELHRLGWTKGCELLLSGWASDDLAGAAAGLPVRSLEREPATASLTSEHILADPSSFWGEILPLARAFFVKKVVLTGPESVGKTMLAQKLAAHYQTTWVEEYGREYTEKAGQGLTAMDFAHIAGGQLLLEDAAASRARHLLFCDTDLIVTEMWAEVYLGHCPPWIIEANHQRRYDLFLLLVPDVHWVSDGIRFYGDMRQAHFERLKEILESRGLPYCIIAGDYEVRFEKAVAAIDGMLSATQS
jgi:cytidyltransferase-like protein